ncbi:hypothetical protein D621_14900 [beta proteobacterium AAP51]|nr:hypothetical protein D621_14900 [beta proteobacterium AAP51]
MKLKFKLAAVAAALATLAGGAHADLSTGSTNNNGNLALLAFNTVTFDWYVRDLGFLMNTFLPTGITTSVADNNAGVNSGVGAVGDKSPEAGLLLNGSNAANFSDPSFASWLGTQTAANVKWMVGAYDAQSVSSTQNSRRLIASSTRSNEDFTNAQLDAFSSTGLWGSLGTLANPFTLSKTGVLLNTAALTGFQSGVGLADVGQSANLFYAVRSSFTGNTALLANTTAYGNSGGLATVLLNADGEFSYSLAPAAVVPLPPALWLMGAGLVAVGGMVRRRRAAALAA